VRQGSVANSPYEILPVASAAENALLLRKRLV